MWSRLETASAGLRRSATMLGALSGDGIVELRAHWRQHLLTLIGIVWGAAAVVLLISLGAGFFDFLDLGFKKTGDRWSHVKGSYTSAESNGARPGRRIKLEREDFERVRANVGSANLIAAEVQFGGASVRSAHRTKTTPMSAGTPDLARIKQLHVARGRFYDEADDARGRPVAVLGANAAEEFFGVEDPLGQALSINDRPFRVVGVLRRKGAQIMINNGLHDDMVFVPLEAGQRAMRDDELSLVLNPRSVDDVAAMHAEVRAALWPAHHVDDSDKEAIEVESVTRFTGNLFAIAASLQVMLGIVGTVTLAMAGVGVANLMIAIVNNRRIELAVRRACGARKSDLLLQLLVETVVVVLAGGVLGVGVGVGILLAIGLIPFPDLVPHPSISVSVLVTTFAVLVTTGLVAGIVPAQLASRVDPSTALRVT